MTEIYLHFRCTHYRLYGNAPVQVASCGCDRDSATAADVGRYRACSESLLRLLSHAPRPDRAVTAPGGWCVCCNPPPAAAGSVFVALFGAPTSDCCCGVNFFAPEVGPIQPVLSASLADDSTFTPCATCNLRLEHEQFVGKTKHADTHSYFQAHLFGTTFQKRALESHYFLFFLLLWHVTRVVLRVGIEMAKPLCGLVGKGFSAR